MSPTQSHSPPRSSHSDLYYSFNSHASPYERRLGGSTRRVITHIIELLPPLDPTSTILDNACGPGFATEELLRCDPSAHIHAADIAPEMIELTDRVVEANGWVSSGSSSSGGSGGSVTTAVMDGVKLGYADGTFDALVTNFGIFFFSDPVGGAREIYRTLKPGGRAAVTCWKKVPFLGILHAVQEIVKPGTEPIVMDVLERWTKRETMERTMREAGF